MSRKNLSQDAPCPCGSGRNYGCCCGGKGINYLVDEEGNIFKSIPMSDELAEIIEEQTREFVLKHGRQPGSDDNLFFDMPQVEHTEHFMVEAMKQAGLDPAVVYAFEKTGLLVTEANEHLIPDVDRVEWEAAVREYRTQHGAESEEDDGNEWFRA
jgi:hypothetical protein